MKHLTSQHEESPVICEGDEGNESMWSGSEEEQEEGRKRRKRRRGGGGGGGGEEEEKEEEEEVGMRILCSKK